MDDDDDDDDDDGDDSDKDNDKDHDEDDDDDNDEDGDEQIYVVGMYFPPNCMRGVVDIRRAAEACPAGCKLLVMGELNINIGFPCDKREEVIVDLLNKLCLVDSSHGYRLRTP